MVQFFSAVPLVVGGTYRFSDEQSHHAKVLRLRQENVRLVHDGRAFTAQITETGRQYQAVVLAEDPSMNELPVQITLAAAMIKKDKFELVLQKAAELGVSRIVPLITARTVNRPEEDKQKKIYARWQSILEEASAQCERTRIPVLEKTIPVERIREYRQAQNLFGYERGYEKSPLLGDVMKPEDTLIVIGPEGGFTDEECDFFLQEGFSMVSFGSRILRAETACIYALSVIADHAERMNR